VLYEKVLYYPHYLFLLGSFIICKANAFLLPMDEAQKNHLKAYGIAFNTLQRGGYLDWL
jgi:hypothetical protein